MQGVSERLVRDKAPVGKAVKQIAETELGDKIINEATETATKMAIGKIGELALEVLF